MRNFRTVAVASATALTLAFTGISAASAQEDTTTTNAVPAPSPEELEKLQTRPDAPKNEGKQGNAIFKSEKQEGVESDKALSDSLGDGIKGAFNGGGSSHFVTDADKAKRFDIRDAAGKEVDVKNLPQWARLWIDGTAVAGIGALVGLLIAAFNFASYNGLIKF